MIPYFKPGPLRIGPLAFYPWGMMVASGFVLGAMLAQRLAARRGLRPDVFWTLVGQLTLGAAIFGHIGFALSTAPKYYFSHPWEFLYVWDGLSSYGGFFGCAVLAITYFRRERLDVLAYCDVLVVGVTAGWAVGRLGCFLAHDHIGRPVDSVPSWVQSLVGWLSVSFPDNAAGRGVPAAIRFELGLVDSFVSALLLIILLILARRPRRPGVLLGTGICLYSAVRFCTDFLRNVDLPNPDPRYLGLTFAQFSAVAAIGLGLFAIYTGRIKNS